MGQLIIFDFYLNKVDFLINGQDVIYLRLVHFTKSCYASTKKNLEIVV